MNIIEVSVADELFEESYLSEDHTPHADFHVT